VVPGDRPGADEPWTLIGEGNDRRGQSPWRGAAIEKQIDAMECLRDAIR
jgi:hypothetical protein